MRERPRDASACRGRLAFEPRLGSAEQIDAELAERNLERVEERRRQSQGAQWTEGAQDGAELQSFEESFQRVRLFEVQRVSSLNDTHAHWGFQRRLIL